MVNIVITGPECTGKSTLTSQLATYYRGAYLTEYAREYISRLSRPYTYSDVVHIAGEQVRLADEQRQLAKEVLFCDTYLEITYVWFRWVFRTCPDWVYHSFRNQSADLYLLCNTDLAWEPDPVRENGGENRQKLFEEYRLLLQKFGLNFEIISGFGEKRLQNAIFAINRFYPFLNPLK